MYSRSVMRKFVCVALIVLASCSGGAKADDQTLTEYCVDQIEAFYKRHDLPFTSKPEERPAICEKWMADHGVTTKAQMLTAVKAADLEEDALDGK